MKELNLNLNTISLEDLRKQISIEEDVTELYIFPVVISRIYGCPDTAELNSAIFFLNGKIENGFYNKYRIVIENGDAVLKAFYEIPENSTYKNKLHAVFSETLEKKIINKFENPYLYGLGV